MKLSGFRASLVILGLSVSACKLGSPAPGSTVLANQAANAPIDFGEFCKALAGKTQLDVATLPGIQQLETFDSSDVVADGGTRVLKQVSIADCEDGSGVTIRFTEDQANGLSGFESFVRNDKTLEVVGLAVDSKGGELATVPPQLAFDKSNNKSGPNPDGSAANKTVYTRMGCFQCHSGVSINYGVSGAEEFWKNAKPVSRFSAAVVSDQNQQPQQPQLPAGIPPADLPPGLDGAVIPGSGPNIQTVGTCALQRYIDGQPVINEQTLEPLIDSSKDGCNKAQGYSAAACFTEQAYQCVCVAQGRGC